MDNLIEPLQNLQYFKDFLENRDSEIAGIVPISIENLNWLIDSIEDLKKANKKHISVVTDYAIENQELKNKLMECRKKNAPRIPTKPGVSGTPLTK